MAREGTRLRIAVALVMAVILPLGGMPFARGADGWNYAAERDRLLPELPADPTTAAMVLVDLVFADDFETATFATMELLRRSGMPLINLDRQVAALPDGPTLVDAAVHIEFVPNLARSVRAGDYYTVEEFNFLLVDSGVFPEPLPFDALMAALGNWGKGAEAGTPPDASVVAGAAVRALGAKRDVVYHALEEPELVSIDMLQLVLLFSHIAVDAYTVAPRTGGSPVHALLGLGVARASDAEGCVAAVDAYDKTIGENGGALLWETFKWALGNKQLAEKFDNAKGKIDKASAILTTLLWLTGIRLSLTANPSGTHFRHRAGEGGKNVLVTATARFDYPLSRNAAACLKFFANIDAFPQGPLPGFRVRWSLDQARNRAATAKLLRPISGHSHKLSRGGGGGEETNAEGRSVLELEPAVERTPEAGAEITEKAVVVASLDKDDFPFALKDLIGLRSPMGFAADKIFDLVNSAIRRLGLPTQQIAIPVEYHGRDILVIEGQTTLFALWYFLPLYVEMWTCDGLKGRWQGRAGFRGDRNFLGDLVNKVLGPKLPATAAVEQQVNAMVDLTNGFDRAVIMDNMELEIELDDYAWKRGATGSKRGRVGTATLTIGGQPAGILAIFDGRNATFDVVRYHPDEFEGGAQQMCPGGGSDSYFP
jgi:hypothetical protein